MIRFDTFRFDYDTKTSIVFSRAVVVLLVRHALLLKVCSYNKLAIFTTNVHTKNECLCHHKTVIRSTEPPISCRCCYRLAFLSVVGYNHFYVVRLCHLSSAFLGLCVGCFIFFEALEIF